MKAVAKLKIIASKYEAIIEQMTADAVETAARLRDDHARAKYLRKINYQLEIQQEFYAQAFAALSAAKAAWARLKKRSNVNQIPQPPIKPRLPSIRQVAFMHGKETARAESLRREEKFLREPQALGAILQIIKRS